MKDETIIANLSHQCVTAMKNPTENRMSGIAMMTVSTAKKIISMTPINASMSATF